MKDGSPFGIPGGAVDIIFLNPNLILIHGKIIENVQPTRIVTTSNYEVHINDDRVMVMDIQGNQSKMTQHDLAHALENLSSVLENLR